MAVQKFLEVSTIHIPNSKAFDEYKELVIAEYDEGFFIMIADVEDYDKYPHWLRDIFRLALINECYRVRIDAIGEDYDHLTVFEWN